MPSRSPKIGWARSSPKNTNSKNSKNSKNNKNSNSKKTNSNSNSNSTSRNDTITMMPPPPLATITLPAAGAALGGESAKNSVSVSYSTTTELGDLASDAGGGGGSGGHRNHNHNNNDNETISRATKLKNTLKNRILKNTRSVFIHDNNNNNNNNHNNHNNHNNQGNNNTTENIMSLNNKARAVRRSSGGGEQTKMAVSEIEKLAQKSGTNTEHERFKVMPGYAYPNTKFNREELRKEMNQPSSYYHDLRPPPPPPPSPPPSPFPANNNITNNNTNNNSDEKSNNNTSFVGSYYLEVLQCFGIPRPELLKETSAFCIAVCGKHAFKTDVMPPVANPMWLSKMRRACIFPLYQAYATVSVGVFANTDSRTAKDGFIGRVVMDLAKLRPGCTYDITLPLRQSNQVYSRQQRGAIRFRFHLEWQNERLALLSYIPKRLPRCHPHERVTVRCTDNRAFQDVARVVHGTDMPGKFSMKLLKATMREVNFVRVHVLRYLVQREIRDTMHWKYPVISCFLFLSWMHSVYSGSIRHVPGHAITFILLHIWKNYALYVIDGKHDDGFSSPTWEEMFMGLLFGKRNRHFMAPLQMERQDPDHVVQTALQYFDESEGPQGPSLPTIARALREGVKRADKTNYYFRSNMKSFAGTDAVDFLVDKGYAKTRQEAVDIGKKLHKDMLLFEHVSRKYEFKDADLYYVFLNFDNSEYVFQTHRPWFKRWFRLLGFSKPVSDTEAHWEFPFATGLDHPRFTVKESLVIRSKESRNLLQHMQAQEELEDVNDLGVTAYKRKIDASKQIVNIVVGIDGIPKPSSLSPRSIKPRSTKESFTSLSSSRSVDIEVELADGDDDDELLFDDDDIEAVTDFEIRHLPKPPNQDINFIKKDDRKIADAMVESRHKTHQMFGHFFNDRAYKLSLVGDQRRRESRVFRYASTNLLSKKKRFPRPRVPNRKKTSPLSPLSGIKHLNDPEKGRQLALTSRKEEYDKLLHLYRHSHNNVIVSKVAVIIQPLVEIAQLGLAVFRALFNIFTWRDPFYTFWVVILGSILVVVLHLFPWRVPLGVAGIAFVGPQNWVLRIFRERRPGYQEQDLDTIVRKRKQKVSEVDAGDTQYFSSYAPDNRPIREENVDTSEYKEVAVPHTPLNYRRFYDWPPEPQYARVWTDKPPENDPIAEQILEDDAFELYDGSCGDDITVQGSLGWSNRARRLAKRVARVPKKPRVPKTLRLRKNRLASLDE